MGMDQFAELGQSVSKVATDYEIEGDLFPILCKYTAEYAETVSCGLLGVFDRIESPIERKFLVALLMDTALIDSVVAPDSPSKLNVGGEIRYADCDFTRLSVFPQMEFGRYRVDFYLTLWREDGLRPVRSVIVECDGHDWHDRTKAQAAHDRKRQNWLVAQGHTVLRFTGSQIHKDAAGCASDALDFLEPDRVMVRERAAIRLREAEAQKPKPEAPKVGDGSVLDKLFNYKRGEGSVEPPPVSPTDG